MPDGTDQAQGSPVPAGSTPPLVPQKGEEFKNFLALAQALKGFQPLGMGPTPGAASGVQSTPARVGGAPPQLATPAPVPGLPGPAVGATPPQVQQGPVHPAFSTGFEFSTKSGRNAAIIAGTMQNIAQTAEQIKRKKFDDEMRTAQGATNQIIFHEQQAASLQAAGDAEGAKKEKEAADRIRQDKKVAKVLEKAGEFGSAAYFGVQQAYQAEQAKLDKQKAQELAQAKILAEQQRAEAERARAEAERQRGVAQTQVTPKLKYERETQLEVAKVKAAELQNAKRPAFESRGAYPTIYDPGTKTVYSMDNIKDAPKEIQDMWKGERASTIAGWDEAQRRASQAQDASLNRMREGLTERGKIALGKSWQPAMDADFTYKTVKDNSEAALKGDQQAQFKVVTGFIASSLSLAKGARLTQVEWNQAQSKGLLAGLDARPTYDAQGNLIDVKMGVALPKDTINNMVEVTRRNFEDRWSASRRDAQFTAENLDVPFREPKMLSTPSASGGTAGASGAPGVTPTGSPSKKSITIGEGPDAITINP